MIFFFSKKKEKSSKRSFLRLKRFGVISKDAIACNLHRLSKKKKIFFFWSGVNDTQTGVLLGIPRSAICVQKFDDSRNSAIHITYRVSLRSSSLSEPRDPLLKVVSLFLFFVFFCLKKNEIYTKMKSPTKTHQKKKFFFFLVFFKKEKGKFYFFSSTWIWGLGERINFLPSPQKQVEGQKI